MNDAKLIQAFERHATAISRLNVEFRTMQKVLDKTYVQNLTHAMMWDVLMELLETKNMITRSQFDTALLELSNKTKAAMEAEQKKKTEEAAPVAP